MINPNGYFVKHNCYHRKHDFEQVERLSRWVFDCHPYVLYPHEERTNVQFRLVQHKASLSIITPSHPRGERSTCIGDLGLN